MKIISPVSCFLNTRHDDASCFIYLIFFSPAGGSGSVTVSADTSNVYGYISVRAGVISKSLIGGWGGVFALAFPLAEMLMKV